MIDTVRLLANPLSRLQPERLVDLGWKTDEHHAVDRSTGERLSWWTGTLKGPHGERLEWGSARGLYMPESVRGEVSLPKLLTGDNANWLDWTECWHGLEELARTMTTSCSAETLPLEGWKVQRVDAVGAWDVPPQPYLEVARTVKLPYLETVSRATSVEWKTPKRRTVLHMYDKPAECGHPVQGALRLEVEVRKPKYYVFRGASGRRVGSLVRDWTQEVVMDVLEGAVQRLGFHESMVDRHATRQRLIDYWTQENKRGGWAHAMLCWAFLRDAGEMGGPENAVPDDQRRWKLIRDCEAAGVFGLSEGSLSPLSVSALLAGSRHFDPIKVDPSREGLSVMVE